MLCTPDHYPGHSGESFCGSELSLDGSGAFDDLSESGVPGSMHSSAGQPHQEADTDYQRQHQHPLHQQAAPEAMHHHQGALTGGPNSFQTNPIDKLYMMQDSYFSSSSEQ